MTIPYTKAHGLQNDFLLTDIGGVPQGDPAAMAIAICNRHTGVGADGWLIVGPGAGGEAAEIRLINSDGSGSEMSGNGTRCAAAFLMQNGWEEHRVTIRTGAGPKRLRLLERNGLEFVFEMEMGAALYAPEDLRTRLVCAGETLDAAILNAGNPQCAIFVDDFALDWRKIGAAVEWHERFPQRTNVSFVKRVDEHTIEVRFWERGAGETMSSGTGSTGAAFAALGRGLVEDPLTVVTPAGPLRLRLEGENMMLTGPAEIVCAGEFYWGESAPR
jgi:diaminopimelate epimerase